MNILFDRTYHGENMLVPLWSERKHLPIDVKAYRFSTSGDGKSKCDGVSVTYQSFHELALLSNNSSNYDGQFEKYFISGL